GCSQAATLAALPDHHNRHRDGSENRDRDQNRNERRGAAPGTGLRSLDAWRVLSAGIHGLLATRGGAAAWFTLPGVAAVSTPYGAFPFGCFAFFRLFSFLRALRATRLGR